MALSTVVYENRWKRLSGAPGPPIIDFASLTLKAMGTTASGESTNIGSMRTFWLDRWLRRSELGLALPLLVLVVAINAVAVWGIVSGRAAALEAARKELELQTLANARALEALLANLRGDFIFLARSPPLARFLAARSDLSLIHI